MFKVGLTGGIGTGKSRVAKIFQQMDIPIVDTDSIVRDLSRPGTAEFNRIRQEFGDQVITDQGRLNREKMREIVFNSAIEKKKLESIIHPAVRHKLLECVQAINAPYCILVIPLLLEARMSDLTDIIIVVDCQEDKQLQRIMQRDHCDEKHALKIIRNQIDRRQRLAAADIVIENNGTLQQLRKAVEIAYSDLKIKFER